MSLISEDLKYTKSHEWLKDNQDGTYTIGITDHAQELLGDIVFVELPEAGMTIEQGNDCVVIESVKAASDVYSPLDGEIIEVNETLSDAPETINESPYADGWIFKIKASGVNSDLLAASEYSKSIED